VTSTIIGATKLAQLDDNLSAIEFTIPKELRKKLDEASAIEPVSPYVFFAGAVQSRISGGTSTQRWTPLPLTGLSAGNGQPAEADALEKAS
jgi:hypothetical protein